MFLVIPNRKQTASCILYNCLYTRSSAGAGHPRHQEGGRSRRLFFFGFQTHLNWDCRVLEFRRRPPGLQRGSEALYVTSSESPLILLILQ